MNRRSFLLWMATAPAAVPAATTALAKLAATPALGRVFPPSALPPFAWRWARALWAEMRLGPWPGLRPRLSRDSFIGLEPTRAIITRKTP